MATMSSAPLHLVEQPELLALAPGPNEAVDMDGFAGAALVDERGVGVDREVAQARGDVGGVGPDHRHDRVGGIGKNLAVAALVHMAVIVGPVDRNDALHRRDRFIRCDRRIFDSF